MLGERDVEKLVRQHQVFRLSISSVASYKLL